MAYMFTYRDNMECILQTMPPYFLIFNTMVKVLTYRLKSGKVHFISIIIRVHDAAVKSSTNFSININIYFCVLGNHRRVALF